MNFSITKFFLGQTEIMRTRRKKDTEKRDARRVPVRRNNTRFPPRPNAVMGNPRSVVIPNEYDTCLVFTYGSVLSNGSATGINKYFLPNAAYDVDPALGSVNTVGFSELASLFGKYRVVEYEYWIEVASSTTAHPLIITVINMNDTVIGVSSLSTYGGNQFAQQKVLSRADGGDPTHLFYGKYRVATIAGTRDVETDDKWVGGSTANPSEVVHLYLGVDGIGNSLTNGVVYNTRIKMYTRFFDRIALSQ